MRINILRINMIISLQAIYPGDVLFSFITFGWSYIFYQCLWISREDYGASKKCLEIRIKIGGDTHTYLRDEHM